MSQDLIGQAFGTAQTVVLDINNAQARPRLGLVI
jgi:hypothetical protein